MQPGCSIFVFLGLICFLQDLIFFFVVALFDVAGAVCMCVCVCVCRRDGIVCGVELKPESLIESWNRHDSVRRPIK